MKTPPPAPSDDPVERLLRELSCQSNIIPDDGFTARVLHSLPPSPARGAIALTSLRVAIIFAGALAGMLLHWSQMPATTSSDALSVSLDLSSAAVLTLIEVVQWASAPSQLIALGIIAATFGALHLLEDRSQNSRSKKTAS